MTRRSYRWLVGLVAVAWALCACGGPTGTTLATPSATAFSSPLSSPLAIPQPTASPLPSPTLTPEAQGIVPLPGLVYRTGDGLWRVGADGRSILLAGRPDALLSPEALKGTGSGLALFVQGISGVEDTDVWIVDLATGEEQNLTEEANRIECCPQWWPARPDVILFGSWPRDTELGPSTGFLTAVHVDGSGYRVLDGESYSNALPAPSPDGQTIAYDLGGTAWLYRWGVGPEPFDPALYGLTAAKELRFGSPGWSPDGKQLAWVVGGYFDEKWQIGVGVFDLVTQTSRLLHPYEPVGVGGWPGAPDWSPDGRWLAYNLWPAQDPAETGLWVFRADGVEEHLLGAVAGPIWGPDGRWLVVGGESGVGLAEVGTWQLTQIDLLPGATIVDWVSVEG